MIHIPIVWDFDLTVTEEYQQGPLFKRFAEQIQAQVEKVGFTYTNPFDYFLICDELKGEHGIDYMQQMVWDAQNGCLKGLTNADLYECGKKINLAPGFIDCIKSLEKQFEGIARIHHFFVSVGLLEMIRGCIEANNIAEYISGVAASEFYTDNKGVINGIKRAVVPFNKNQWIIGFMKGDHELLNTPLNKKQYKFDYRKMIVIGDGQTDTSKFAYTKKRGGTPIAVYEEKNEEKFAKAKKTVGLWVDYILPRNYAPGLQTYDYLVSIIKQKIYQKCFLSSALLYNYKKKSILDKEEYFFVEEHVHGCQECERYFDHVIVPPNGKVEHSHSFLPYADLLQKKIDQFK